MSSMPREALNTSASKPGVIGVSELDAQRLGARDHFLRIGDVGRRDLVHHLGGGVAQHPLGADVEDLDDALGVGGDAREVGADQDLLPVRLGEGLHRTEGRERAGGGVVAVGHRKPSFWWQTAGWRCRPGYEPQLDRPGVVVRQQDVVLGHIFSSESPKTTPPPIPAHINMLHATTAQDAARFPDGAKSDVGFAPAVGASAKSFAFANRPDGLHAAEVSTDHRGHADVGRLGLSWLVPIEEAELDSSVVRVGPAPMKKWGAGCQRIGTSIGSGGRPRA